MSEIECPYCEESFELEYDYDGTEFDQECPHCGEEIEITVEFEPSFSASKIVHYDCEECGKEYRFSGDWYPHPKKYTKESKICETCRRKLLTRDWEVEQK